MSDQLITPTQEQEQEQEQPQLIQEQQEQLGQIPQSPEDTDAGLTDADLIDVALLTEQEASLEPVVMTFDNFDQFMEKATDVELFNCKSYWPTSGDIELYKRDFPLRDLVLFLSWLLEMNEPPNTDAEVRSQKAIKQFVYEYLNLVEELPTPTQSKEADAQ